MNIDFIKKTTFALFSTFIVLFTVSCNGQSGQQNKDQIHYDALETYKYWAGRNPSDSMKVLNGQYWASDHFTKEYIMYLELKATKRLVYYFPKDNKLVLSDKEVELPKDAPSWFKPPKDYQVWLGKQGSLYFINQTTGHVFFYEVQL